MATKRIPTSGSAAKAQEAQVDTTEKLVLASAPLSIPEPAGPQYEAYLESETPGGAMIYRFRLKQ